MAELEGPFGDTPEIDPEILRQVSPEFAWGYEYYEGLLMVSKLACESYGLEPVVEVKSLDEVDTSNTDEVREGLPRTHLTVVGPAEMQQVIDLAARDSQAYGVSSNEIIYAIEGGRVDIIMGFDATTDHTADEQRALFERMYGTDGWPIVRQRNTSDSFSYALSHLIADSVQDTVEETLPTYWQRRLGLTEVPAALLQLYTARVGGVIHEVFCSEEHLPLDFEIPDAI